jgi:hypothetical protein
LLSISCISEKKDNKKPEKQIQKKKLLSARTESTEHVSKPKERDER